MSKKLGGTAIHHREKRNDNDFYRTPQSAVEKLLSKINFSGDILEPASGMGDISIVLEKAGYNVKSQDIIENPYGLGNVDFLNYNNVHDNIVTNPPYSIAKEFIEKGLELCNKKLVLLLRLAYLESQGRYHLFKNTPLDKVIIMSKRLEHWNGESWERSGQFSHA